MGHPCIYLVIVLEKLDFMEPSKQLRDLLNICEERIIICDDFGNWCDIIMDDPLEILDTIQHPLLILPRNVYLDITKIA